MSYHYRWAKNTALIAAVWCCFQVFSVYAQSYTTTGFCGGEEEIPCAANTRFFQDNGNLWCDRGLQTSGMRILNGVSFNAAEAIAVSTVDITGLITLIDQSLPALHNRVDGLSQDDFLRNQCLGTIVDGQCFTTPPIPGRRVPFVGGCVIDLGQGGSRCTIPGIPGALLPLPDFSQPGWTVANQLNDFRGDLNAVIRSLSPAVTGQTGLQLGSLNFDLNPPLGDLFDFDDFTSDFNNLINYFSANGPLISTLQDIVADLIDPLSTASCTNNSRRQTAPANFQQTWEHWAALDQHTLADNEPLSWVARFGTHNAFNNTADGYVLPNQRYSITDQLNIGARYLALDIHWFNNTLRLCHGQQNHFGCSLVDRYYYNGIKEIANWLYENPDEVILIEFEDRSDASNNPSQRDPFVTDPIVTYLGDRVLRTDDPLADLLTVTGDGMVPPELRWPTQREMRMHGKQVIFFGSNFISTFSIAARSNLIWHRFTNPFMTDFPENFVTDDNFFTCEADLDGMTTRFSPGVDGMFNTRLFSLNYEARSFLDPLGDPIGFLTDAQINTRARCNLSILSLDFLNAQEDTSICPSAGPNICAEDDTRVAASIWHWLPGQPEDALSNIDNGQDAAIVDGVDGRRWRTRDPNEQYAYACAPSRQDEPLLWADRAGLEWAITAQTGVWSQGWLACDEEFPGYIFAAPVNGWQNERLRAINTEGQNLWLNYSDIRDSGIWSINGEPTAIVTVDNARQDEGSPLVFSAANSSDPDNDALNYQWDFGDGNSSTALAPNYAYADNGSYTVELTVQDALGAIATDKIVVQIDNVAPVISQASLAAAVIDENDTANLVVNFTDPGADLHSVLIDWGDGNTESLNLTLGDRGFNVGHQYLDDDPTATITDDYIIQITITDDDNDSGSAAPVVTVNNIDPVVTTYQLYDETGAEIGTDIAFALQGLRIDSSASFSDIGSQDTHVATINWSDGSGVDDLGAVTDPLNASHIFLATGAFTPTLALIDDDTGTHITTTSVQVVNALGGLQEAVRLLQVVATDPAASAETLTAIDKALGDLQGQNNGRARNGAIDMLEKNNLNSTLQRIEQAIDELDDATGIDWSGVMALLSLTAKSIVIDTIRGAELNVRTNNDRAKIDQAKELVLQGDGALAALNYQDAVSQYQAALVKVK